MFEWLMRFLHKFDICHWRYYTTNRRTEHRVCRECGRHEVSFTMGTPGVGIETFWVKHV